MADQNNTPNLDEEELESTVLLTDEEGNEYAYDIADYIDVDDQEYVVLVPQDEETDVFVNEENEAILERVFEIFKDRFEDEYEFTDAE